MTGLLLNKQEPILQLVRINTFQKEKVCHMKFISTFICHCSSPPNFRGKYLKFSDQNNWGGGPEQKIKFFFLGGAKFKGGPKILWRGYEPNDAMIVVLKDIILCC